MLILSAALVLTALVIVWAMILVLVFNITGLDK